MIRHGLNPIIFVLNNKGYTIERYLHGKTRKYNDITNWKWTQLLSVLGGEEGVTTQSYTINTKDELDKLLNDETFNKADKAQLVEVMMDQFDAPRALQVQAELSGKTNKYTL
jgi:pyruvate decarboxylase